jgi:Polysaccharide pyruvyl transferase
MQYSVFRTYSSNLGDEIQNLAAAEYLPRIDYQVNREQMFRAADHPPSFLIANGWYLHNPRNFPPPPNLHPLYISVHLADSWFFTPEAVTHFKRHEPIGCRDLHTLELFRQRGVAAYFSGCLTWTLRREQKPRTDDVYLVDLPGAFVKRLPQAIRDNAIRLTHLSNSGFTQEYRSRKSLQRWSETATQVVTELQRRYRDFFCGERYLSNDELSALRLLEARHLLRRYARARLVVTTRIHCYFPCLAFRTPAILLSPKRLFDPSRFDIGEKFFRAYSLDEMERIHWDAPAPDIAPQARFLELLCKKAVELKDNPLKYQAIDDFYKASGWSGSGIF